VDSASISGMLYPAEVVRSSGDSFLDAEYDTDCCPVPQTSDALYASGFVPCKHHHAIIPHTSPTSNTMKQFKLLAEERGRGANVCTSINFSSQAFAAWINPTPPV